MNQEKANTLPKMALGAMTILGIAILAAIVFSHMSDNLKIAVGVSPLSMIIGSIATLLNKHDSKQSDNPPTDPTQNPVV